MSILGVDARKKIAELIKQIQEQSGGFGPPSAGYGDGELYNGPEPVVGNAIKKVATFKPEIPFGTDIARKVVEGTENLGNQLVPPLELGPVKLTGSEQLDILLSGLLQKQKGEVEVPSAKKTKTKSKVREPELSPIPTTVPDAIRRRLEAQGRIKPQPTIAPELTGSHIRDPFNDFLELYDAIPVAEVENRIATRGNTTPAEGARAQATIKKAMVLERELIDHPDPLVRAQVNFIKKEYGNSEAYTSQLQALADEVRMLEEVDRNFSGMGVSQMGDELIMMGQGKTIDKLGSQLDRGLLTPYEYSNKIKNLYYGAKVNSGEIKGLGSGSGSASGPGPGTTVPKYKGPKLEDVDPELAGKDSKYNEFLSQYSDQPQVNLASPTGKAALQEFDALAKKYKAALNGGSIGYAEYNQLMEEAYQKYRQG